MNILRNILEHKKNEIYNRKKVMPTAELVKRLENKQSHEIYSLKDSIKNSSSGIIAEFKRKSPSKGWINRNADIHNITKSYCKVGASALSILTDHLFFGGNIEYLKLIRSDIEIPILRKDFIIDEYQVYESLYNEADAILLIANNLTKKKCNELSSLAHMLNLEVLLEIHNEREIEYLECNPDIVGINNRNLETFKTDIYTSFKMAEIIPESYTKISESGISTIEDIISLKGVGYDGFLIGETLMKDEMPDNALRNIIKGMDDRL